MSSRCLLILLDCLALIDGLIIVWKFEKDKPAPVKEFGEEGTQDVECWMSIMSFRYPNAP